MPQFAEDAGVPPQLSAAAEAVESAYDALVTPTRPSSRTASIAGRPRASSHRNTSHETPNGGSVIKGPWSETEDEQLRALVVELGAQHWSEIANRMVNRTGKQCRERYVISLVYPFVNFFS